MSDVLVFGGGDIAKGIAGVLLDKHNVTILEKQDCDVRLLAWVVKEIETYQPSVVINCAGVSNPARLENAYNWEEEIDVNLKGSFNVAQASVWRGVETTIFIASIAGMYGKPEHAAYSASKGGVISLVQSLGMEGYNAYAVSPGRVNTKMREKDYPGEHISTRLDVSEIGKLVEEIMRGNYDPGDNIMIRRIGYETAPIKVDKGPWREELKVGQSKLI